MTLQTLTTNDVSLHPISPLLLRVLGDLDDAAIAYCVLRGGDHISRQEAEGEVDLLVPPQQLPRLREVLARLGFVRLRTWGHAPHHFFVAYDDEEDRWLKLDVVTRIAYGRPTHPLPTPLAERCLRNRRPCGPAYIPAAADELATLLLHCVVDKGEFPEVWRVRLQALASEIGEDDAGLSAILAACWSPMTTARALRSSILEGKWDALLTWRAEVVQNLSAGRRLRISCCRLRDHFLRKLNRLVRLVQPHALSVALVAPDGAGKSTLAESIKHRFYFPVEQIYMGLYQQGRPVPSGKGPTAGVRLPGFGLVGKLLLQWGRYARAHFQRGRGRFVVFDRYTYDAYLPARRPLGPLQRLRRWVLGHACPAPHLILILDAPGEVLYARKGEHSADYLEQHRQAYLSLRQRFPQMVVVDATRDADRVCRDVISRIWRGYADRLREVPHGRTLDSYLVCSHERV